MKKIKCSNCQSEINETDKFCNKCGAKVEEEIVVETVPRRGRPKKIVDIDEKIEVKEDPILDGSNNQTNSNSGQNNMQYQYPTYIVNNDNKNSFESKKKYIYPIIAVIVTFSLCLCAFTIFYQYYLKNLVIETTKREVTVTDTGISDAVEKVYDSVVVVESYSSNKLFSTGTGFVYKVEDDTAYILTNYHVVNGSDQVKVVFTNNERDEVEVVGSDSYTDVALLAIDKDKIISVAEIGSSEDLRIGDTTFAVGAPIDSSMFSGTTTRGILSGKNRIVEVSLNENNPYSTVVMEVLQTDTAINNGNSGGPLCNSNGQVIGITNMGLSKSVAEGMSFAIPIETATKMADKFIKGEKITYPYIGVSIYEAVPTYKNPNASGVFIESVEKGSMADKGGLKSGDKIIKVDGVDVNTTSMFRFLLYKHEVGEKVKITVERDGKEKTFDVTLGSNNPSM